MPVYHGEDITTCEAKMPLSKITVDVQEGDQEWVQQLVGQIDMLTGMIIEATETGCSYLLSPTIRSMLRDKAKLIKDKMSRISQVIFIDNPGDKSLEQTELERARREFRVPKDET